LATVAGWQPLFAVFQIIRQGNSHWHFTPHFAYRDKLNFSHGEHCASGAF